MSYVYGASRTRRPSTGVVALVTIDDEWRSYLHGNERAREEYDRKLIQLERNPRGSSWGNYSPEQKRRYLDRQAVRRKWRYDNDPEYRERQLERNRVNARARRARKVDAGKRITTRPGQGANQPAA